VLREEYAAYAYDLREIQLPHTTDVKEVIAALEEFCEARKKA
jgi:hypothetical protein